jgi:hypothetical protein
LQNPFEVQGRTPVETFSDTLGSFSDSLSISDTTFSDKDTTTQLFAETNYLKLKESNPFEVTHIPLIVKRTPSIGQIEIKIQPKVSNTFIFWIMLFSWALLALVLGNRRDILPKLFQSVFNENMLKLTKKQDGDRLNLHFIIMYIVFVINASVFIYLISKEYGGLNTTKNWFLLLLTIAIVYIVRHIVMSIISWVFPVEKEATLYSFLIMVLNLILGLFLIPVNLLMAFGSDSMFKPTMFIGIFFIAMFLLARYFRGFFIGANYVFNNFFLFFIYLCAVELTPLLIGIRMIKQFL